MVKFYLYVCWFALAMMAIGAAASGSSSTPSQRILLWGIVGIFFVVLAVMTVIMRVPPSASTVRAMSAADADPGSDTWEKTRTARYAAAIIGVGVLFGLPWFLLERLEVSPVIAGFGGLSMSFVCARWVHFFLSKADLGKD